MAIISTFLRKARLAFIVQRASRDAQNDIIKKHPELRRGTNRNNGRERTEESNNAERLYT